MHPKYSRTGFTPPYDIALVKLATKLDFNGIHKNLLPVCLPTVNATIPDRNKCVTCGFGRTPTGNAKRLQKVLAPVWSREKCEAKWWTEKRWDRYNGTVQVCANGYPQGGFGSCYGDSGGPLQCKFTDGRWYQIGAVNYSQPGCVKPGWPDVYSRVSFFHDWIADTIKNN